MIKIDTNTNVWVMSDPHYNHKNICRGVTNWRLPNGEIPINQTRDFRDLDHMNSTIVDNINQMVMQDEILICLGDWSFGGFESIREFWDRLVCKNIHLVLGNHDTHIEKNKDGVTPFERFMGELETENKQEIRDRINQTIAQKTKEGQEIEDKFYEYITEQLGDSDVITYAGDYSFMDMIGIDMLVKNPEGIWVPVQVKKYVGPPVYLLRQNFLFESILLSKALERR